MWWIEMESHRNMQATPGIYSKGILDYDSTQSLQQILSKFYHSLYSNVDYLKYRVNLRKLWQT